MFNHQSQASLHEGTDLPSSCTEDDEVVVADLAADEAAKTQIKLQQLNQSTIDDLKEFVKDNPTADLWLRLREASRTYKAERAKHTDKPAIASKGGYVISKYTMGPAFLKLSPSVDPRSGGSL